MANEINMTITNTASASLKKIRDKLAKIPQEAYKVFVAETPVRSGNARRSTRLNGNTIHASYPYAQRLDDGYSKQSPAGMVKPTEDFVKKRVSQIVRGK